MTNVFVEQPLASPGSANYMGNWIVTLKAMNNSIILVNLVHIHTNYRERISETMTRIYFFDFFG